MNVDDFTEFENGLEGVEAEPEVEEEELEEEAPELEAEEEAEKLPDDAVQTLSETEALRLQLEALQDRFLESQEALQKAMTPQSQQPQEFLSEEEFEEALTSREAMNAILARVAQQAVRSVPQAPSASDQLLVKEFYEQNPELRRFKGEISRIAGEVSAQEPGLSTKDILEKTAARARTRFGLQPVKRVEVKKPASTVKSGRARQKAKPQVSSLQQDLDLMLQAAGL